MDLDFTNLTLVQVVSTLLFFAVIDTGFAYVVAFMKGTFNPAYALDFLRTHILKVGAPIVALAVIGHGVNFGETVFVPPVPAAGIAATGFLLIYVLVTVASIKSTWEDNATPPTPSTAVSPVTEA